MANKIKNPVHRFFPAGLPEREWVEFEAVGFKKPVTGAVFTGANPPCCGLPLGGLSTGCLDLDVRGTFGFSSIFHPSSNHPTYESWRMPRRLPHLQPFLGLSSGGRTWVLSTPEIGGGQPLDWCTEPQMQEREGKTIQPYRSNTTRLEEVAYPEKIELWGHYPVADLEYTLDAPLQVGEMPLLPTSRLPFLKCTCVTRGRRRSRVRSRSASPDLIQAMPMETCS